MVLFFLILGRQRFSLLNLVINFGKEIRSITNYKQDIRNNILIIRL